MGKGLRWGGNLESKFEAPEGQVGEDAHLRYQLSESRAPKFQHKDLVVEAPSWKFWK